MVNALRKLLLHAQDTELPRKADLKQNLVTFIIL